MKKIPVLTVAVVLLVITGCFLVSGGNKYAREVDALCGLKISGCETIRENDTHGGFHGDGLLVVEFDCTQDKEDIEAQLTDWHRYPMSPNLNLLMYGGEKDGVVYGYELGNLAGIPMINNGVYKFIDRHPEATDSSDDTNVLSRGSFNFSLLIYDYSASRLYFVEYDT